MNDCVFCAIVRKDIPAQRIFESEVFLAFPSREPRAPIHLLVVPKSHIISLSDESSADQKLLGGLLAAVRTVAQQQGLANSGYKVVVNVGPAAGQSVPHLHAHVLGGGDVSGVT